MNIHALYTSACQREVGVILKVDDKFVYLLNLAGQVKPIRPYEIIYFAFYPAEYFPAQGPARFDDVEQVTIMTLIDEQPVELVRGWPLAYTTEEISLLNEAGQEQVIQRRNIYSLGFQKKTGVTQFRMDQKPVDFEFEHPFAFRDCPVGSGRKDKKVFPQQTLNQPIAIKRELDELKNSYLRLKRYESEQRFYALPEIYRNQTSLGLWTTFGSRYGSSTSRNNNFTPVLTDSYSSDIFDYQHVFVTGSAPMSFATHEEAQTQAYYAFKASYFRFALMLDPSLILVGEQYRWRQEDFSSADVRLNDVSHMEMGVDFGHFSFQIYPAGNLNVAAYDGTTFVDYPSQLFGFAVSYQKPGWKIEGISGSGNSTENSQTANGTVAVQRVNLFLTSSPRANWQVSVIQRRVTNNGTLQFNAESTTLAAFGGYRFWKRYEAKGFVSVESTKQSIGSVNADRTIPKAGGAISLYF